MKQIDKIKMLVGILEENVEMLESYPRERKEWETRRDKHKDKFGNTSTFWEQYPSLGTSRSHIKDIAKLIRKELLKI